MLTTNADGTPLCFDQRWSNNHPAWMTPWKHHAAQPEANRINELGQQRGEAFINAYGGRYSSEWFFSKLLETLNDAPDVYAAADRFIEGGDWIVWQLCGEEKRSLSHAGYKAMWVYPVANATGPTENRWSYPLRDFFQALHPRLENVETKLSGQFLPLGGNAGRLTPRMAKVMDLLPDTPVAVANIDAHVAVPACSVTTPGKLVMIMGTSTCHLLLSDTPWKVEGMCGVVQDGVVPGYWGYEAGQAGVGDLFAW